MQDNGINARLLDITSFAHLEGWSNMNKNSPLLTFINIIQESGALLDGDRSKHFKSLSLEQLKNEINISKEDGFCFAVSLRDGSCIYTSDAITYHLGYPKDMLVGQLITNFLLHKDHMTFKNNLSERLNACFIQGKRDDSHPDLNAFFCRLRLYQGLKQGCYSVSDRKTEYRPFKITLEINELIVDDMCVEKPSTTLCMTLTATHVSSVYSVPEEIPAMTSFSTRHTASCNFSDVDASAVPYLGYLPQDMIGSSVFDFYHVDDLPRLKKIYELVIKEPGSSFQSKPYRFKAQNGCFIMLETEWFCFIDPWSHKLEFVIGQHRVLKGPSDINIFTLSSKKEMTLPEETLKECQNIQREIKTLLSESIHTFDAKKTKRVLKKKRDLADINVSNCIGDLKGNNQKGKDSTLDMLEDKNISDPDIVVMGDIPPYREVRDSSVTTGTPPSVEKLQYQANIERFFASHPKTFSDGSGENNKNEKLSSVEDSRGCSSGYGNGPVMYLGGMYFFPPAPNTLPQWPLDPAPSATSSVSSVPKEGSAGCFQIPIFSPASFPKFISNDSFNQTNTPSTSQTCSISTALSTSAAITSAKTIPTHKDMELESKRCYASSHCDKIDITSEFAYGCQMNALNLDDVLKKDMEVLKSMPQPELVKQQLQGEIEAENENKLKVGEDDSCMTEEVMFGLITEDDVNEEMEFHEESPLQLLRDDS